VTQFGWTLSPFQLQLVAAHPEGSGHCSRQWLMRVHPALRSVASSCRSSSPIITESIPPKKSSHHRHQIAVAQLPIVAIIQSAPQQPQIAAGCSN
jgi:hypothetical protein